jgi:hypothetical protein
MKKVLLFTAIAFSLNGYAQKVTSKPTFQKGQKLEVITTLNTVSSQEMGGQSMESKADLIFTRNFTVQDVANGTATIEHKVKRVQMKADSPMGEMTVDSDKPADLTGQLGEAIAPMLKNNYNVSVDPSGNITAVKLSDDNPNKENKEGNMMMAMLRLDGATGIPKVGGRSEFSVLPARELSKGETWTDTTGGHNAKYTIADINEDVITVRFTDESKTDRKQEMNGMEISYSGKEKAAGMMMVDRKTGLLRAQSSTIDSDGTIEVMGQTAPTTSKVTINTIVKTL